MAIKDMIERGNKDPFRVFFLLGWIFAILGVLPWISFAWFDQSSYPGGFHAVVMSRGFMSCFVFGFLMTSIPKFTETEPATSWELAAGLTSVVASAFLARFGNGLESSLLTIAQIALVVVFIGRRFLKKKNNPPGTFFFLATGLVLGAAGSIIEIISLYQPTVFDGEWHLLGRLLSFYGMILAIVLGIGARLFPGILGWVEIVQAQRQRYERPVSYLSVVPLDVWIGVVLFLVSFIIESFYFEQAGRVIRASLVTYVAMRYWKLYRFPPKANWMKVSLMISAWTVVAGEWLAAGFPGLGVDGKHLVFIGGFALLSFLVGARVTLAHGEGLAAESRRLPYIPLTALILVAAATRVGAHWTPTSYVPHLAYASVIWLLGVASWGVFFAPRLCKGLFSKH